MTKFMVKELQEAAKAYPIIFLLESRGTQNSSFIREVFPHHQHKDLDHSSVRLQAETSPEGVFAKSPCVVHNIQRVPALLQILASVSPQNSGDWILCGCLSVGDIQNLQIASAFKVLHCLPSCFSQIVSCGKNENTLEEVLLCGSYFSHETAPNTQSLCKLYRALLRKIFLKDIPEAQEDVGFYEFMQKCAGRSSLPLNTSILAEDCSLTEATAERWVNILVQQNIAFYLQPLSDSVGKRLCKAPKLHFYDSGLVCHLLDIKDPKELVRHSLREAIFESWVISEIAKMRMHHHVLGGMFYYRDSKEAEIPLLCATPNTSAQAGESSGYLVVKTSSSGTPFSRLLGRSQEVQKQLKSANKESHLVVVYAGEYDQRRTSHHFISWRTLADIRWHEVETGAHFQDLKEHLRL